MRHTEERASQQAVDRVELQKPIGSEGRRPPRARLFGGDTLRGGKPVGVGHAGSMRAKTSFSAIIVSALLLACSLLPYGGFALADTAASSCAIVQYAATAGKLDGCTRWDMGASLDYCIAYAARESSGEPSMGRSIETIPFRPLPLLLTKTVSQPVGESDALSIRAAAISGASIAAVATLVSLWRHEPKGRHATKRRKTRPLQ